MGSATSLESDGGLKVTFADGLECTYAFSEIKAWKILHGGWLCIFWEHKSVRWPAHFIKCLEVINNSPAAQEKLAEMGPHDVYSCAGCGTELS